jgi:5-methyltetrahydropteroyltriglutamate--homocysteine methyltransferase
MKTSTNRTLTTHCGSLARPHALLDLMKARYFDGAYEANVYAAELRRAVTDCVRGQAESGIDVISDGEMGKTNFAGYVRERLTGFEPRPGAAVAAVRREAAGEAAMFPEYYREYAAARTNRGYAAPFPEPPLACTGPIDYQPDAVQADIDNLRVALEGARCEDAFLPAASPRTNLPNEYYRGDEEYRQAYADAVRREYLAITAAGFVVQVDDPGFATQYGQDPSVPVAERVRAAEQFIETLNYALRGIPEQQVRFHTCYSINMGPRVHDAAMRDIAPLILRINAGAYSFEAANPRHAHEWRVWEDLKLPQGKLLIPGFISHTTPLVEHPEWIADQIVSYARLVGRENLLAGADCGFSSLAMYHPEIHPSVVWAKLRALAEGARLASERLWPGS